MVLRTRGEQKVDVNKLRCPNACPTLRPTQSSFGHRSRAFNYITTFTLEALEVEQLFDNFTWKMFKDSIEIIFLVHQVRVL
jgi:hypothetical protein